MTITSSHQAKIEDIVEAFDQLVVERIKQHDSADHKSQIEGEKRAQIDKAVVVKMIMDLLVTL